MRKLILLSLLLTGAEVASAQCSSTAYGAYTCVGESGGFQSSVTARNAAISVTVGDAVILKTQVLATGSTITPTDGNGVAAGNACAGSLNSYGGSTTVGTATDLVVSTTATSTGTCTIRSAWGGSSTTIVTNITNWNGWNGVFDTSANLTTVAVNANSSVGNCSAVTTTIDGDLVLCEIMDSGNNTKAFTGVAPFAATAGDHSLGEVEDVQATHGAITPQFHYSQASTVTFGIVTITLGTGTQAPTFSLTGGPYSTSLPKTSTVSTSTASAVLCVTICTTNGCTPSTPTAPTPGTCTVGTQYNASSQNLTPPVGYSTYSALATKSGLNNSGVVTSGQYQIVPTLSSWNGGTVGNVQGNIKNVDGVYLNPFAGYIGSVLDTTTPLTAIPVTSLMDGHGGTNTNNPTTTTLANSTYGDNSYSAAGGSGLTFSNTVNAGNLPQPILIGSTVYGASGTIGLLCTSNTSAITATLCGIAHLDFTGTHNSVSVGFWYQPSCATGGVDCGANGGMAGGTDFIVIHSNGVGGNCPLNGTFAEIKGGNASNCLTYTNNQLYRVNMQLNKGAAAFTATFSTGSPSITATQTLSANQAVQFTTSGTLPAGISANTTYFVLSSGLSGSAFQVAAVQGGTPIQVTTTGTGTQTVTQYDLMTLCTGNPPVFLGTQVGPALTTGQTPSTVWMGVSGEGPQIVGPTFFWGAYVFDNAGKFSTTECIL